tara:strand:+ start:122 stop:301 length:180 start_codon:yes stop_codon:yes gene_type:complete
MSSNVVDGLLEVLSEESLGLDHIILVDESGTHYRIQNLNIKEVLAHKDSKMLFVNIAKI